MAGPATYIFRLPTRVEAQRVLSEANSAAADSPQIKARRNLYKALDWAYRGMNAEEKARAKSIYGDALEVDLAKALDKTASNRAPQLGDAQALAILDALTGAKPSLQHPGGKREIGLSSDQKKAIESCIRRFEIHEAQIRSGDHNDKIDTCFPPPQKSMLDPFGWGSGPAASRKRVTATFTAALQAVKDLHRAGKVQIDGYGPAIRTGGLTSPEQLLLEVKFFEKTEIEQEAVLVHESTHAIPDATKMRTNDNGGYIGRPKFDAATLEERYFNASHYEAVIRLINGEQLPKLDDQSKSPPVLEASETVRKAWDKAINLYLMLQKYHNQGTLSKPADILGVRDISQLFGLPAYKGAAESSVTVTASDLSAAENRVGKLGVMLGAVEEAARAVQAEAPPVTADKIFSKLVEWEGTIRKSSNPDKTVDMIKVLADLRPEMVDAFKKKTYK